MNIKILKCQLQSELLEFEEDTKAGLYKKDKEGLEKAKRIIYNKQRRYEYNK